MNPEKYFCQLCELSNFKKIKNYIFLNKIFSNREIVECTKCSLKFIYPMPNKKTLEDYNKNYFINAHEDLKVDKIAETYFNCLAKCRVNYLEKFLKSKEINIKEVLEIGPGKGYLYENFKNKENINYSVLETDIELQNIFKKKNLKKVYNNLHEIEEDKFDLVIISHVLEHVDNPNNFLANINKFLRKDGIIFLEVPCLDYLYKEIVEPHLFFYDKETLSLMLNKNNFNNYQISYFGKKISEMRKKIYIKG